jgi:hypothetical protein
MFHCLVSGSISRWRHLLPRLLDQQAVSEPGIIIISAMMVGGGAGLGAVFFRWLIKTVQTLAYGGLGGGLQNISHFYLLIIPAIGGAIYGPLIHRFAQEAKGHGVPEVMEAVALHGGRIRPRVAVIKSLASAICIGTGGSIGREGPIAQIGSALDSNLGQLLHLSGERMRNLVACGAAGGIAATFNAPIAGSIFALEVILRRRDIIQAYNNAIAKKAHDRHHAEFLRVSRLDDADFANVKITPGSASAGRLISELKLPKECLIVSVRRGNRLIIPHGYTRLRAKDQLTIFVENECLAAVEQRLDDPEACQSENADDQKE